MVRKPAVQEMRRLEQLLTREEATFSSDQDAAAKLLAAKPASPNLTDDAAYTVVAQVLLNLDEAITKE